LAAIRQEFPSNNRRAEFHGSARGYLQGPYLLISKEMLGLCMDEDVKNFP